MPSVNWWWAYSFGVAFGAGFATRDWTEGAGRFVGLWIVYGAIRGAVWCARRIPWRLSVVRVRS